MYCMDKYNFLFYKLLVTMDFSAIRQKEIKLVFRENGNIAGKEKRGGNTVSGDLSFIKGSVIDTAFAAGGAVAFQKSGATMVLPIQTKRIFRSSPIGVCTLCPVAAENAAVPYFRRGARDGKAAGNFGTYGDRSYIIFLQFIIREDALCFPVIAAGKTEETGTDQNGDLHVIAPPRFLFQYNEEKGACQYIEPFFTA